MISYLFFLLIWSNSIFWPFSSLRLMFVDFLSFSHDLIKHGSAGEIKVVERIVEVPVVEQKVVTVEKVARPWPLGPLMRVPPGKVRYRNNTQTSASPKSSLSHFAFCQSGIFFKR